MWVEIQLQINHPVESSAHVSLILEKSAKNMKLPGESSAIQTSHTVVREFGYRKYTVESSAINKSPCMEFRYKTILL